MGMRSAVLAARAGICHSGGVPNPPTRISGPKVAAGFLLLVLTIAGTAIGLYLGGREPLGRIRAMTPVDASRVLLVREGHRQHGFAHFSLRDLRAGQTWTVPFNAVPAGSRPAFGAGRALLWVQNANVRLELHAFDLETGAFTFRSGETPIVRGTHPTTDLVVVGDRAVASVGGATPRVDLVDLRTGRLVVAHTLEGASERAPALRVVASGVEVRPADGVVRMLTLATGTLATLPPMLVAAPATADAVSTTDDGTVRLPLAGRAIVVRAELDGRPGRVSIAAQRDGRLWVASGASVASIDVAGARVVASHGPSTFTVRSEPSAP